ncbi:NUDIX domain-containing protein [Trueperella pyogenes]|uniref:NUDIX hydrolase n=1 Tax=Trueperella pyogenes TaxID=1661 RepID=UPI000F8567F5|nr:NUDIX domain-containing protein [Trueperella pyogenes]AZR01270.1 NUDIX domain-containing protein [Trueperella pyogenes]
MVCDDVLAALESWRGILPANPNATYHLDDYLALVREGGESALWKGLAPRHLTASLFVLSPDLTEILLDFHKKAGMWLQFGGHLEHDDASLPAAALREGREESGLSSFVAFSEVPCDLDVHSLGGGFTACREHWDVGFVALARRDAVVNVSDESERLGWFPVDDLPDGGAGNMSTRVAAATQHARRVFNG